MNYHFTHKRPDRAYITNNLVLPKEGLNLAPVKAALTFLYGEEELRDELGELIMTRPREIKLWAESKHHIIVPREFFDPGSYHEFGFEFEDQRPAHFCEVDIDDDITLRDEEQGHAFDALLNNQSGTLWLACGKGKSVLALKLATTLKVPTIIIVNSTALLEQWKLEIQKFIDVDSIGTVQGKVFDWKHPIVVSTVQTLSRHREKWPAEFRLWFGLTIYDECFPAGTLVGSNPIEEIKPGDLVPSYDPALGEIINKKVIHVFQRPANSLMRLRIGNQTIACTPNHPFLTDKGWVIARDLTCSSMVLCFTHEQDKLRSMRKVGGEGRTQSEQSPLLRSVYSVTERKEAQSCDTPLHVVQRPCCFIGKEGTSSSTKEESILLRRAQVPAIISRALEAGGQDQQEICFQENEEKESNDQPRGPRKNAHHDAHERMETNSEGRQWTVTTSTSDAASMCTRLANGSDHPDKNAEETRRLPNTLQAGHRQRNTEAGNRGGRLFTRSLNQKGTGQEKERVLNWARVDSIEILQPGSDGTFGGLCPDGFVYNLEVEDTHTYIANGAVVHNCHHISAPTFVQSADLFFGRRIALTATAMRTDGLQAIYQHHIGKVIYKNLDQDLIPLTIFHQLKWEFDERYKPRVVDSNGDLHLSRVRGYLGELDWRNEIIYDHLLQDLGDQRQVLVLSHSVPHVEKMHEQASLGLRVAGGFHNPGIITGKTPQEDRMDILRNCNPLFGTFQLAREGLDKPTLDTLYITTPFSSDNDAQQSWGRTQRILEGKKNPLVRVYEDLAFDRCVKLCQNIRSRLRRIEYPFKTQKVEVDYGD